MAGFMLLFESFTPDHIDDKIKQLFFRRHNFIWDWIGLQRFPPCKFITDYMATTFTLNTCNVLTNSLNQVQCLCHSYVM